MANYTQHYQLHQWVPEDDFLRTDFNEDFKKIDTAIKSVETDLQANLDNEVSRLDGAITTAQQTVQKNLNTQVTRLDGLIDALEASRAEIIIGTYTGNGESDQQITLGFRPKAVLVEHQDGRRSTGNNTTFWAGLIKDQGGTKLGDITAQGFTVHYYSITTNTNCIKEIYYYLALK